jgi:hypothetical protein
MPALPSDSLRELQKEIETFVRSLRHPVVVEDEEELFDLTAARWKLSVEFGKLLLEVWNDARSIGRRVEEAAYRDRGRLGLFVRKAGARETSTLELRDLVPARAGRKGSESPPASRGRSRRELLALLARECGGWKLERVSNRSDREHSFSTWYTRGLARQGRSGWAFLGLGENEPPAAADTALAQGLIWLDWLRARESRVSVSGLKLFLPAAAVELSAHRAACLNHRALQAEIFAWDARAGRAEPVDLKDFGNVETHLVPRRQSEALLEQHAALLGELLGGAAAQVDVVADATGNFLSLRVLGLEIARLEGRVVPRVLFGLEGQVRKLEATNRAEFREFLARVLEVRRAGSPRPSDDLYRLQSERWLECRVLKDMTRLDPALSPGLVYPQVPAFAGQDRGVIDLLSVTRQGRLSVIELKLEEEINLPLQGLDYWLRIKWLAERGAFQASGYFPQIELAAASPLLYLVSPAFRFHSSTDRVLRYLDPAIEIVRVGLNQQWRRRLQVLFRRERSAGA